MRYTACGSASLLAAWILVIAPPLKAENWPQWRGPQLNGSSAETGLPQAWSLEEGLRWSVPVPGKGSSTPVVWGDRLFMSSVRDADNALVAVCLDTGTGATLWEQAVGEDRSTNNNTMASPSPVTDGVHVCFTFGMSRMICFDMQGQRVWERDFEKEFGYNALMFGYSSSPLLHAGALYLPVIRNQNPASYGRAVPEGLDVSKSVSSYVIAVDLATGVTLWRVERPMQAVGESQEAYTTPVALQRGDRTEILVYGADRLSAHDVRDGRETWSWEGYNPTRISHWRVVATPVVGPDLIYVCGPKYSTLYALRPPAGDGTEAQVVWTHDKMLSDASTPLLYRGRLYVLHDNQRVLLCLDPQTGAVQWRGDLGGRGVIRASLTGADGCIYILYEMGEALVVKAGERFEILHRVQMGTHPARATIAVSGGALFVRTGDRLACVGK